MRRHKRLPVVVTLHLPLFRPAYVQLFHASLISPFFLFEVFFLLISSFDRRFCQSVWPRAYLPLCNYQLFSVCLLLQHAHRPLCLVSPFFCSMTVWLTKLLSAASLVTFFLYQFFSANLSGLLAGNLLFLLIFILILQSACLFVCMCLGLIHICLSPSLSFLSSVPISVSICLPAVLSLPGDWPHLLAAPAASWLLVELHPMLATDL